MKKPSVFSFKHQVLSTGKHIASRPTPSRSYSESYLGVFPNENSTINDGVVGISITEHADGVTKEGGLQPQPIPNGSSKDEGARRSRRTTLEKVLIALTFVFIATVIFLVLFFVFKMNDDARKDVVDEEDTCKTWDCLQSASQISESIDPTVHPCEDFYQFACGKWIENHPATPHNDYINTFDRINEGLKEHLRDILEVEDPNATEAYQKARKFYKSCEDTDAIPSKGVEPLKDLLGAGLFPTISPNWQEKNLTLNQIVAMVDDVGGLGSNPFIVSYVDTDVKQSTRRIIYFVQPRQTVAKDFGPKDLEKIIAKYTTLSMAMGADENISHNDATNMLEFETAVANVTKSTEGTPALENAYMKMTLRNLSNMYPQFNWTEFLQHRFKPLGISIAMEEEVVLTMAKCYYDKLFDIINATPERTLLNYCLWRFFYSLYGLLDRGMRDDSKIPIWQQCLKITNGFFMDVMGRMYIEKHFSPRAKHKMDKMITNLKEAVREIIQEADWMCEPSKKYALEKADAMVDFVGYPVDDLNDTFLNSKFENLTINEGEYFNNIINLKRFILSKTNQNLRSPIRRDTWPVSAATVNAMYLPTANAIIFPAGILHTPFFSENFTDAMNYAGIGFFIGHEITHGFDNTGRTRDKEGKLKKLVARGRPTALRTTCAMYRESVQQLCPTFP